MLGSLEAKELGGRRFPRRFQEVPGRPPGDHQEDPRRRPGGPGGLWEAPGRPLESRFRQEAPGDRQETARKPPRSPQDAPDVILTTLSKKFVLFRLSGPSKMSENWPQNVPRRKKIPQETPRESR